ncbi:MAG: DUF456 domain-containing protein [Smithellaceae bacterium]|nr:DUF456 domain-containing protein [Smithellaceae bacterium]
MEAVGSNIFIISLLLGLLINIFGLPGPIVILVFTLLFSVLTGFSAIGIGRIFVVIILTVIAEVIDYRLGIRGAFTFRLSGRSVGLGTLFGAAGALILTPVIYAPGFIIGLFLGSFGGVFLSELLEMGRLKPSMRNNRAILLGGLAVLSRGGVSLLMIAIILTSIYS